MTTKQARFVEEYLIDLNATQAAIRAGYSAKTAHEIGRQNLRKLEIAAEIKKAQTKRAERVEVTADWVVNELRKIAGANMADYMKSTPSGDPYHDFSALTRSAAKGIPPILAPPGIRRARTVDNQVADPSFIHSKRPGSMPSLTSTR